MQIEGTKRKTPRQRAIKARQSSKRLRCLCLCFCLSRCRRAQAELKMSPWKYESVRGARDRTPHTVAFGCAHYSPRGQNVTQNSPQERWQSANLAICRSSQTTLTPALAAARRRCCCCCCPATAVGDRCGLSCRVWLDAASQQKRTWTWTVKRRRRSVARRAWSPRDKKEEKRSEKKEKERRKENKL